MKPIVIAFLCFFGLKSTFAQNILIPSESAFEKKWIGTGTSEFGYYFVENNIPKEIGTFTVETINNSATFSVFTKLAFLVGNSSWKDSSISQASTFKPIYRSSYTPDKEMVINFGKTVTGYYLDKKTKKKTIIKDGAADAAFESYTYPYLIAALPLETGYRKDISIYDYKPYNTTNIKKSVVEETKSNVYKSSITGEHKVWQVTVLETATNERYVYYIDKDNRKMYKIEIFSGGLHIMLLSKEIDFTPIKSAFDKAATLKQIKDGNSVITGQAFARDNQAPIKGIAILNVNKKQYAAQGTAVILIPKTAYFEEWRDVNESLGKKKKPLIALPQDVRDCIKTTTIYDDEGHFEFTNLLPGEYLVFTQFGYVHTATGREVIGYTDTYINGNYQGSTTNTRTYSYGTGASASVEKTITIKDNGDKVSVKLKKTK
jgi:hypothetical protein